MRLWDLETATVGAASKDTRTRCGRSRLVRTASAWRRPTEKAVRLWDVASGKELRHFGGHKGTIRSLAFSGDGRRLLSSDQDGVRLWDVENGKQLRAS